MEQHLGRKLIFGEAVHHIDGNKLNNIISNLKVMEHGEHVMHHKPLSFNLDVAMDLLAKGEPSRLVARKLGTHHCAILAAMKVRGITMKSLRGESYRAPRTLSWDIQEAMSLISSGATTVDLGRRYGVTSGAIWHALNSRGIKILSLRELVV